jgi:DNA-binding NtrC family response regulator
LAVVEGPDKGKSIKALRGVVRVGTASDNDLVLSDDAVSRRHLEIRLSSSAVRVVDLDSTNGTKVDGVSVIEALLAAASRITIGSTTLRATAVDEDVMVALSTRDHFGGLLGQSAAMREVFALLERVAPTEATVVLEGETGTGKEVAAEAIHAASPRAEGPLVAVDCGAIPANLIESELFGHMRGAFTGAIADRQGVFEQAHGGTLFLDEIGELPLELQPKLLRVLEKRQVRRLGDTTTRAVDVRVVAATNRDLAVEVNRGGFREDLYFRLAVVRVVMPPLRTRREDVPRLIEHFVSCLAPERLHEAEAITRSLSEQSFPGNVRELRNAVERAVLLSKGEVLGPDDFVLGTTSTQGNNHGGIALPAGGIKLADVEEQLVREALSQSSNNQTRAAKLLGISRDQLRYRMERYSLR